jgi:hypothetical protein
MTPIAMTTSEKTNCPEPGIYRDVPEAEYRAWPLPSYSTLAKFRDEDMCELEIKYAIENPPESTAAMNLGNMVERAVDGLDISPDIKKLPPEIKARRGVAWDEFQKQNPGIEYLPPSEFSKHESTIEVAKAIGESVRQNDFVELLLTSAERQVSFVCDLEFKGDTGELVTHRVKGRADYVNFDTGEIADLKTTAFGNPRRVGAYFWQKAYDVQSALYTDCLTKLTGREMAFYFIVARTAKPYVVTIYNGHNTTEMAGHYLSIGRNAYQMYLEQLRECVTTNTWRGYYSPDAPESRVLDIYLPTWAN